MAFPEPTPGTSAERLYREAKFFFDKYEEQKAKAKRLEAQLALAMARSERVVAVRADNLSRKERDALGAWFLTCPDPSILAIGMIAALNATASALVEYERKGRKFQVVKRE